VAGEAEDRGDSDRSRLPLRLAPEGHLRPAPPSPLLLLVQLLVGPGVLCALAASFWLLGCWGGWPVGDERLAGGVPAWCAAGAAGGLPAACVAAVGRGRAAEHGVLALVGAARGAAVGVSAACPAEAGRGRAVEAGVLAAGGSARALLRCGVVGWVRARDAGGALAAAWEQPGFAPAGAAHAGLEGLAGACWGGGG
jgi:hypothetical protein